MGEAVGKLSVESHRDDSGAGIDIKSNAYIFDSGLNVRVMENMSYAISKSADIISAGQVRSFKNFYWGV